MQTKGFLDCKSRNIRCFKSQNWLNLTNKHKYFHKHCIPIRISSVVATVLSAWIKCASATTLCHSSSKSFTLSKPGYITNIKFRSSLRKDTRNKCSPISPWFGRCVFWHWCVAWLTPFADRLYSSSVSFSLKIKKINTISHNRSRPPAYRIRTNWTQWRLANWSYLDSIILFFNG